MMAPKTIEQMVAIFRGLPLQWVPGEKYAYNNSGYFLLGVVIFPESEASFFARVPELTIVFVKDAGGKVTHFMITQAGRTTKATRIE